MAIPNILTTGGSGTDSLLANCLQMALSSSRSMIELGNQ